MNVAKPETVEMLEALFRNSYSVRQIQTRTGLAKATIEKYRRTLNLRELKCGCGKSVLHRGWCKVRYQRSPKRMKYWESRFVNDAIKVPKNYDEKTGYFGI